MVFFFHSFNWALQMLHFPLIREFRIRFFFPVKEKTKYVGGRKSLEEIYTSPWLNNFSSPLLFAFVRSFVVIGPGWKKRRRRRRALDRIEEEYVSSVWLSCLVCVCAWIRPSGRPITSPVGRRIPPQTTTTTTSTDGTQEEEEEEEKATGERVRSSICREK